MLPLPIDASLPEITDRLRASRSLVLVAPPGAGKTTRVPPAILRAGLLSDEHPNLVMLQPRRVAARTAAARIADENHWKLGNEVGYHVRFDRMLGPRTRLRVLTEGILTRQLLDDPFLEGIGAVLLDEFHERSLYTDVAVALLREVQQTVRPDLMLVIMSATLEAEAAAVYLGNCPIVRAEGRTYPIDISYEPQQPSPLPERVTNAVARVVAQPKSETGDVLAFLPGADEIRRAQRLLEPSTRRHDLLVLPLHGSLPAEEQNLALRPAERRKVILATNIAETSLTIDGVRTVIDGGYARVASYDADRGLDRLDLKRISKASAAQRAGRAGRTAPGRCVRLWSEKEQYALDDFELPEVKRVDLSGTVLALHAWGKPDVRKFGWYEAPGEEILVAAERLLAMLGALTSETAGQITPLGRKLMSIPAHPRLGRLLLASVEQGLLHEGATLAALMAEKDILLRDRRERSDFRGPSMQGSSDLLDRLALVDSGARLAVGLARRFFTETREGQAHAQQLDRDVDPVAMRQVMKTRDELLRISRNLGDRKSHGAPASEEALLRLPLNAYPDRVCRRREKDPAAGAMVGGGGVRLAAESTVRQGDFFLAVDARHDPRSATREAMVCIASLVRVQWLHEMFPQSIRRQRGVEFDPQRQRVIGFTRTWYHDLLLEEDKNAPIDPTQAGEALAAALRPRAVELFKADESTRSFLARVALLRRHMPEHPWPMFTDEELADALAEQCASKRSTEEVLRSSLIDALRGRLVYPLDRLLEEHAPEAIEVPTGNRIRLEYTEDQPPVLAVRLQELFGWTQMPSIAGGRVRVRLHLLGPNYRPVQVTDDLQNFWATTYFQVRKDLRARYPKHSWPEDPLTATAVARGRSRK
jgi:ATP-dependent helicase HrpB